jgi:hypothetical protein
MENDTLYFTINGRDCDPLYTDNLSIEHESENAEMYKFKRRRLSGALKFIGDDFDYIMSQPISTRFIVDITENGAILFKGYFHLYDTLVNYDDKSIGADIKTLDQYDKIIAALDTKFDLLKIGVKTQELYYDRRPILQLYAPGDIIITNFIGGTSWEEEVITVETDHTRLVNTHGFGKLDTLFYAEVNSNSTLDVNGVYVGYSRQDMVSSNGLYRMVQNFESIVESDGRPRFTVKIQHISTSSFVYNSGLIPVNYYNSDTYAFPMQFAIYADDVTITGTILYASMYARYVAADMDIGSAIALDENDLLTVNSKQYNTAAPIDNLAVVFSYNKSEDFTEYGTDSEGLYYLKPSNVDSFVQVGKNFWGSYSFWVDLANLNYDTGPIDSHVRLDSAIHVGDAINRLLKEIDTSISHEKTEAYSKFLYGSSNPIVGINMQIFITQISNILRGDYDAAAKKAEVSLGVIFKLLSNMQCYWHIKNSQLIIEHNSYYKKGYTYCDYVNVQDLTKLIRPANDSPWLAATNSVEFDKSNIYQEVKFAWGGESTEAFEGSIIAKETHANEGNIKELPVQEISADLDLMITHPDKFSNTGFCAMVTTRNLNFITKYAKNINSDINSISGAVESGDKNVSGFINVRESETQLIVGTAVYWYDINKVLISSSSSEFSVYTAPFRTRFMRITGYSTLLIRLGGEYGCDKVYYTERLINNMLLKTQNGVLSFNYMASNFWIEDYPSYLAEVDGNYHKQKDSGPRIAIQSIKVPHYASFDENKLIKSFIGVGEIKKIVLNLLSRIKTIELLHEIK